MAKAVSIILNEKVFIKLETGDGFDFAAFIVRVRADGFYFGDDVFIPLSQIKMIVYRDLEVSAVAPHIGGLN